MPDAAEAAVAGLDFGLEDGLCTVAQHQVDIADDGCTDRRGIVARARSDAGGKLDFSDRAQFFRSALVVHRVAFDINGANNIVTGGHVGDGLFEHVAFAGTVPQMVMGIDDGALRIYDIFLAQGEPILSRLRIYPMLRGGHINHGHAS